MDKQTLGYFVLSLDTELGTGLFDKDKERAITFSPDGSRERWAIRSLLDLMDEYNIQATWAIVGHLFYERCEYCKICPLMEWKGKYRSFEEAYGTSHPLWYGADAVEEICRRQRHDIGFHGYTHKIFNPKTMSKEDAKIEVQEWLRVASRKGIVPKSVVFPRDKAGHLDVLREYGFICYRTEEPMSIWIRNRYFGAYIKTIDHLLAISTPPLFTLENIKKDIHGMIAIPASMHFKGFNWGLERWLDNAGLHLLRLRRMVNGIHKAAEQKKIIHFWLHPWEVQTPKDLEKMRYVFQAVAQEIERGRMQSITMLDLANKINLSC
ncbi:MAG: polysaccharide deacetylase family protein [Anaerolineae bacterium]|nr:polysaccharide deacetylase family protein [Anaerolineae bacterium]